MVRRRRDSNTLDIFKDYRVPTVVERFDEDVVKSFSIAGRLAKALGVTLSEADRDRAELAEAMSEFLEDEVSKNMLDKYASSSPDHQISAVRLIALVAVTDDPRALNTLLKEAGLIAVPEKFEALIRRERAREIRAQIDREEQAADAAWKASQ